MSALNIGGAIPPTDSVDGLARRKIFRPSFVVETAFVFAGILGQ